MLQRVIPRPTCTRKLIFDHKIAAILTRDKMKLIISVVVLAFSDGAFSFAPVKSMTSRQSKLFSMETETKMDETEEMYLEIEYEGFFDGTKVSACCLLAVLHQYSILDSPYLLADILLTISLILLGTLQHLISFAKERPLSTKFSR